MIKAVLFECVYLLVLSGKPAAPQAVGSAELVEIQGLKPEYSSCSYVNLSIKNVSQQDVYVEIYAEKSESGSWDYEAYPYDIKDPKGRYAKRVLVHPKTLKPGASLPLTYDRCQRPTFVKESDEQYRKAIIERDSKSSPSALQRFRVQVYVLEQGHVKFVKNVFSEPFKRTGNSRTSPTR